MNAENTLYIIECIFDFIENNSFVLIPLLLFALGTFINCFKNVTLGRMYSGFCGDTDENADNNIDVSDVPLQDWEIQINKYVR